MKPVMLGFAVCAALALGTSLGGPAALASDEAARAERWNELKEVIFEGRELRDGGGLVALDAPMRALEAALVPITITLTDAQPVQGVYVVIDENPAPMAAHVVFGPGADPHLLKLRVRVNEYTQMHVVAETADGTLYQTAAFVKAAGGCSAPVGAEQTASLTEMGRMKLRLGDEVTFGEPVEAQLMIRHPNFSGMQMDQLTRLYTPMRFVETVDITYGGEPVLHVNGDISLSTDPVLGFSFVPKEPGQMKVVVRDSDDTVFEETFDIPARGS